MAASVCILSSGPRASGRLWQSCWLDGPDGEGVDAIKSTANESGELLRVELTKEDKITRINLGPNQKVLVSTRVGHIFLLDLNANRYRRVGSFGSVRCTALDRKEGLKALVGLEEGRVLVLDCVTGAIKARLAHPGHLHWVGFSEGGKLGVGMGEREATVWNLQQYVSVYRLKICDSGSQLGCVGLLGGVGEFKFRIVSSNSEGQVTVWGAPRATSRLQVINQFGEQCQCDAAIIYEETIFIGRSGGNVTQYSVDSSGGNVTQYSVDSGELLSRTPTPPHLALTGLRVLDKVLVVEHKGGLVFVELGSGTVLAQMGGGGEAQVSGRLMARAIKREGVMLLYKLDRIVARVNSKHNRDNPCADFVSKESPTECSNYMPHPQNPTAPPPRNVLKVENTNTNAEAELILNNVTKENLLPMLKSIREGFPSRHREVIWCQLLSLPRNKKAFNVLVHLGPHPAIAAIPANLGPHPAIPATLDDSSVILSALFHWSPCLSLLPYIQLFLSPFANLFSCHPRAGFEVCLTVLHNYCHDWWRLIPRPPSTAKEAWQLLDKEDSVLKSHLHSVGCDMRSCVWPILQTGWSTVLPPSDWCILWDHLLVATPSFLSPCLVATLIALREGLLRCTSSLQVSRLVSSQQGLQVSQLLQTAYTIQENQPNSSSVYHQLHKSSYPKSIQLENEKEIIAGEQAAGSKIYLSTSNQKYQNQKIMNALKISPPPLPRIAHNVKKAGVKATIEKRAPKTVLGQAKLQSEMFLPNFDVKSSCPSVVGGADSAMNPLEPLLPRYTRPTHEHGHFPSNVENETPDGIEDIVLLLDKAKFIRSLLSTK